MKDQIAYLDSSAIVKRYVEEPGSSLVRGLYLRAYSGDLELCHGVWNIGEVLGVLDRAKRENRLDDESHSLARRRFLNEARASARLGFAIFVPVSTTILVEAWELVEKHHMYQADALQVVTARETQVHEFYTSDKALREIAEDEGLHSTYIE